MVCELARLMCDHIFMWCCRQYRTICCVVFVCAAPSFDMESLSDHEGTAGKGHITNYAQNINGTVWNLAKLRQHMGE